MEPFEIVLLTDLVQEAILWLCAILHLKLLEHDILHELLHKPETTLDHTRCVLRHT